jgi:RNA polymerase-interacting CarD/CdnL/TRCF family regulator
MNFYKGDMVMHWSHGIGEIVNLEERALADAKAVYYVVQVRDMTV